MAGIVLKLTNLEVALPYSQRKLTAQPAGDILLSIDNVPGIVEDGGQKILTTESLKFVFHQLEIAMYLDMDKEDF